MSTRQEDWTVLSMLEWATDYFSKKEIPDPRHSIEWLLAETLNIKRLDLYLNFDRPLSPSELEALRPLVKRRAGHEPLQYIVGYTEFMNARIQVNPDVLIPRLETEQLVEIILDEHPRDTSMSVMDIGTGSGCIPIALKMERPEWQITACDISQESLDVARDNAHQNETDVNFIQCDITDPRSFEWNMELDMIVSNPPYILPDEKENLEPQVYEYEPSRALFCDSMENMYGSIINFAQKYLKESRRLYLEIHELHADTVSELFDNNKWRTRLVKDYDKKARFIIAQRH